VFPLRKLVLTAVLLGLSSPCARSAELLSLPRAFEIARAHAPTVLAARERIAEAQGRLEGASVLLHQNPVVEAAAGPSFSRQGRSTDVDFDVRQGLELAGQRGARIAGAQAGVMRATAGVDDDTRRLLHDVAVAFSRGLAAGEQSRLRARASEVAANLVRIAERRHQNGEVAILDVNAARIAAARARAEARDAEAEQARVLGDLHVLLGLDADDVVELTGTLDERPRYRLDTLLDATADRPDLRALAAELREADADRRLGEASRWPEVGVRLGYKREEEANVPMAGFSVSLPVFANGQEQRASASSRARRLRVELESGRRAAATEVRAAFDAYQREVTAVEELEHDALPLLDESDTLATRSYELGQTSLPELLAVRREVIEARLAYTARQLDAARARFELEARAGVLK
jgi:outer membrane protein, heavy metal efflux system